MIINIILFIIYGLGYCLIDYVFWKHPKELPTAFICDGTMGVVIGLLNEIWPFMPIYQQVILGCLSTLCVEFIAGCILNLWLKLDLWDYNRVTKYNILGQICPLYIINWIPIVLFVIFIDDVLRNALMLLM